MTRFMRHCKNMEVIRHRARNVGGNIDDKLHYAAVTLDTERNCFTPPKGVNAYSIYYCQNISGSQERRSRNNNVVQRVEVEDDGSYATNAGEMTNI